MFKNIKINNKLKYVLIYLFFFISLVIISCLSETELDGIWNYGFSYNIASGLLPYKDFNMVVGPFYPMLMSILIKIFGNYFYLFEINNSLIYALILTFVYKKINKKSIYVMLILGACLTMYGYNTFCSFLVIAILLLEDSNLKYKDILIGIIIGLMIMTKHNIGLCISLVYLYLSHNKIKSIISIIIPIITFIIYLLYNDIFYEYIDMCYLGLGNFLDNFYPEIFSVILLIFILIVLIKRYKKTKDNKILYLLAFSMMCFPICDQGHIVPTLIPITYYLLLYNFNKKLNFYLKYFISIGFVVSIVVIPIANSTTIITDNCFLMFQTGKKDLVNYLESYSNYLDNNKDSKIYILLDNAYLIRLYRNENPSFYDLINKGNFGSDEYKYIDMMEEECSNKKCIYILDKNYFKKDIYVQRLDMFKDYVTENMTYLETLPSNDRVYINNKK